MPTVDLDPDVYQFLLRSATRIGEDASSILRRLLPLTPSGQERTVTFASEEREDVLVEPVLLRLAETIGGSTFQRASTVTERFLLLLSFAHAERADDFRQLCDRRGRKRQQFARSKAEIAESGTHTHPRPIPETAYWVSTNSNTAYKRQQLDDVYASLGFSETVREVAVRALVR